MSDNNSNKYICYKLRYRKTNTKHENKKLNVLRIFLFFNKNNKKERGAIKNG